MNFINDFIKTIGYTFSVSGIVLSAIGIFCSITMFRQAIKNIKGSKANALNAVFLAHSTPGFSKSSIFNNPDTLGIGVYTCLALEQVGAYGNLPVFVDNSLKLYPEWPASYLMASRFEAIFGDKEKAKNYLINAKSLIEKNHFEEKLMPQLEIPAIESLIVSQCNAPQATTTIEQLEIVVSKKPGNALLAKSTKIFTAGVIILLAGVIFATLGMVIK